MIVYQAQAPEAMTHNEWQTRKNVKAVEVCDSAFLIVHFVCRHDVEGYRWGGVPGMWFVSEGYYNTGHVVDEFGDLVEVCGFYGE